MCSTCDKMLKAVVAVFDRTSEGNGVNGCCVLYPAFDNPLKNYWKIIIAATGVFPLITSFDLEVLTLNSSLCGIAVAADRYVCACMHEEEATVRSIVVDLAHFVELALKRADIKSSKTPLSGINHHSVFGPLRRAQECRGKYKYVMLEKEPLEGLELHILSPRESIATSDLAIRMRAAFLEPGVFWLLEYPRSDTITVCLSEGDGRLLAAVGSAEGLDDSVVEKLTMIMLNQWDGIVTSVRPAVRMSAPATTEEPSVLGIALYGVSLESCLDASDDDIKWKRTGEGWRWGKDIW